MPGGLFFPPANLRISSSDMRTLEYNRAMAAIFPLGIMLALVVVCLMCADWCGKRNRKRKAVPQAGRVLRIPQAGQSLSYPLLGFEKVLKTPTGSDNESTLSFDYMNMSFGYNNNSVGKPMNVPSELERTYEAPKDSLPQTTTPPYDRVRFTPPELFKMDEYLGDVSRSPSPRTLIREGKEMRYGAFLRTPLSSSTSPDTSEIPEIFPMSFHDEERQWLTPEEKEAKEVKRLRREKRRQRREKMDDEAEKIRAQINWTVQDDIDQKKREERAIDIPPRKRVEEHPQYQRVVRAMFDQEHVGFDATTVLNTAWEKGRMEAFVRENLGYAPDKTGDFSILRDETGAPDKVEIQPLRNEPDKRQKPRRISEKGEVGQHQGARRKARKEAKGKKASSDQSLSSETKESAVTEPSAKSSGLPNQGVRRKVRQDAKRKEEILEATRFYAVLAAPDTEPSEESSRFQNQDVKSKISQDIKSKEATPDVSQFYTTLEVPVTEPSEESSEFQNQGVRRKISQDTKTKEATPDVSRFYTTLEVPVTEPSAESYGFQHQDARRKVTEPKTGEASAAYESQQLILQHDDVMKRLISETEAKSKSVRFLEHVIVKRYVPGSKLSQQSEEAHQEGSKEKPAAHSSQPLIHRQGEGKNYGTMVDEARPTGVSEQGVMDSRVPVVVGKEYEERRQDESRRVSHKIARAVFDIEIKRLAQQLLESDLGMKKDVVVAEVHAPMEPSSPESVKKQSSVVVAETHAPMEPSSPESVKKQSSVEELTDVVVEMDPPKEPSSSGLVRRKTLPVAKVPDVVAEVTAPKDPSSPELVRRMPSPVEEKEDVVIDIGSDDNSSSWEDVSPVTKYIWWPGIGDRKRKGDKKKKYGKK